MRLLDIEDFIFYIVCKKYQKWAEKESPGVYALCFITLMQMFNTFSLFIFFLLFKIITSSIMKGYGFFLWSAILLGMNYWYIYRHKGKDVILRKYEGSNRSNKVEVYSLLYVLLTLVVFIGLMIYYIYFT